MDLPGWPLRAMVGARVKVRKGEPFWFMERHAATSETDDAQVAWRAILP